MNSWWPCRAIVESAIDAAPAAHPSGLILVLDQYCPWSDHLFDIEEERKGTGIGRFTYVLYPDSGGMWRVQVNTHCQHARTHAHTLTHTHTQRRVRARTHNMTHVHTAARFHGVRAGGLVGGLA